jgi:ribosomal protein S12 methylthiotransferase
MIKVGLVSLGCAKNLIDSEIMIGHLQQAGMVMTPEPDLADVLIVNTCSFIDMAKKESIGAVHDAVDGRSTSKKRTKQKIIVAGCLSQRFSQELPTLMPDVDAFIGLDQITQVAPIIQNLLGTKEHEQENLVTKQPKYIPDYDTPRFRLTPQHMAYIKIAEGCNHPCSFCIIPRIRGRHRSRTQESIVQEARQLVKSGVKEINLISQDTTYFGMDKWEGERPKPRSGVDSSKGESLSTLIRELNKIEGDFWIRLLYTHPAHWSDDLIQAIAESPKVARYIDMPLQHISDHMLDLMKRETNGAYIRDLVKRIRAGIPGIAIRTTFIVGFPGETEEDFQYLLDWLEQAQIDRAGCFKYEAVDGAQANALPGAVPEDVKEERWHRFMALQSQISQRRLEAKIGRTIEVLIDEVDDEGGASGRSKYDAPEIDGMVHLRDCTGVQPGDIITALIEDADEADLFGVKI